MPFTSYPTIGSTQTLTLQSAILLYRLRENSGAQGAPLATVHPVGHDGRKSVIMPGQPVTSADIEALAHTLSQAADTMHFLPPQVLSITTTRLIWHVPGKRRRLWFNSEAKSHRHLNGKLAAFPALLFDATINAGLRILALPGDKRPTPATPIYRAPFMNLYSLGEMCRGNAPMPKCFTTESMETYEKSFFNSAFSHTNLSGKALCAHPRGPVKMWEECLKLDKFPTKWLCDLTRAKGDRAHHDDSRVRTVGDFIKPQKWTGYHPL